MKRFMCTLWIILCVIMLFTACFDTEQSPKSMAIGSYNITVTLNDGGIRQFVKGSFEVVKPGYTAVFRMADSNGTLLIPVKNVKKIIMTRVDHKPKPKPKK